MKRRRRAPVANIRSNLRVEQDVATGVAASKLRPRGRRYSNLKLPHERDESIHRPGTPSEVTELAATDLEAGRQDTDCYAAAGARFDRKQRKR